MKKFILIISILFFSCNSTTKEINNKEDIEKTKELTVNFYKNVKEKNYNELIKILDSKLDPQNLKKIMFSKDSLMGDFENYTIDNIQTTKIKNNKFTKIDFIVETIAIYKNDTLYENLNFEVDSLNNTILKGYHFKTKKE